MLSVRSLLAVILLAATSYAQTFRGGINGTVTDSTGSAIAGAAVKATNTATGLVRESLTTGSGEFTFQDLPLGPYQVSVSQTGFEPTRIENINVEVSKTITVPVKLGIATQSALVEVAASNVNIETTSVTLGTVIPTKAVQDIPLNGRDFTQLVRLAPGVNGAGSINGTRTSQNNWQIDGADNNDLWHNSAAVNQGGVSGVAGTILPIDAIDQFSVTSNGTAEFGRNGGGAINMVIKSGTNALHGSVYYFNRNDALAAKTPFAPAGSATPKLKNNQFGASVGGPIIHNKTFFFLTYERQKLIVGNGTGATEPSGAYVTEASAVLARYGVAVNPVSTNLLSLWPARGRTGGVTSPNFFSTDNSVDYSDNGIVKLDHTFNERHSLSARWFVGTGSQTAPVGSPYHEYYQVAPSRMQNYSVVYNTVLSARAINQILAGVNYFKQTFNDFETGYNPVALGLNTGVTNATLLGAPSITINGFDSVGLTQPSGRIDTTGHILDTFTYTIGRHQLRAGGEFRRSRGDVFYQRNKRGTFSFDGSQGPWKSDATVSVADKALADFLAGYVASASITLGNLQRNYYANAYSWFAQDTFQVNKKLNLNYGINWIYQSPFSDPTNRISTFIPSKGGVVFAGKDIDTLWPRDLNNFAPRFGFAYQTTSKFVIRGGYGIFYDVPNLNAFADNRPPNSGAFGVNANPAGSDPVYAISRSNFTIVPNQSVFASAAGPSTFGVFSVSQHFRNAYVQNYNLNGQYQLGQSTVIQVGYVGSLGRKLLIVRDINQLPTSALGASTVKANQQALRPFYALFPTYGTINEVEDSGNSAYNGVIASIRTSNWHRVISQFSYTGGHAKDTLSSVRGRNPTNSYDLHYDYGNSDFDVRHTFTAYVNYALPNANFAKLLLNGWQLNSLLSFHSGTPFTVFSGLNVSGTFEGRDRVDLAGDPFAGTSSQIVGGAIQYLNKSAFSQPANGTFGNEPRNKYYGPGFGTVDFSTFKNTKITERVTAQLRIELFNLFNRTNLPNPNTTLSSGSFGKITDTIGDANGATGIGSGEPRNLQLALKIIF